MDRKHNFNQINRNRSMFNNFKNKFSRNNVVAPEILVSHVWMQDEDTNGVEIIELNSSDSGSLEEQPATFSQAWDCVDNRRFRHAQEDYQINKTAREKRRLNNNENVNTPYLATYDNFYYHDTQVLEDGDFNDRVTDFHNAPLNHQMNCFTIINNHVQHSDSSSENDYTSLGVVEHEGYTNSYWDHVYSDDRPKYDTDSSEKRTIFIYSFKNRHLLSEDNFELVNIPGSEGLNVSSSSSTSEEANEKSTPRLGSPVAPTYIPRLNLYLGQTLSTVTEAPELKLEDSDEEQQSRLHSWLTDRREKVNIQNNNVINWMALSPRERRQRFKITEVTSDVDNNGRENTMYMEGNHNTEVEITDIPKREKSSKVQIDVDVHAIDEKINTVQELNEQKSDDIQSYDTFVIPSKIPEEIIPEIRENTPRINLKSNITTKSSITSPIQKLDSNNWIVEETIEMETSNINYDVNENCNKKDSQNEINKSTDEYKYMEEVSQRLYAKNLKFVRASEWNAFLPITGSSNSLHLTISCSTVHEKRSCLQKLFKYFKCCR